MPLAETGLPTLLFLCVLGLVIGLLLTRSQRYFGRSSPGRSDPGARPSPAAGPISMGGRPGAAHHLDAPEEVRRWEVEMHEIARQLSATLETKIALLDRLVREADRVAGRLEGALDAARSSQSHRQPAAAGEDRHVDSQVAALGGVPPDDGWRRQDPSPQERYREIYALADSGHSTSDIAGRTGMPIGEVQLILSIRRPPGDRA